MKLLNPLISTFTTNSKHTAKGKIYKNSIKENDESHFQQWICNEFAKACNEFVTNHNLCFFFIKLFLNNYAVILNSIHTPNLKPQNYHWIPSPNRRPSAPSPTRSLTWHRHLWSELISSTTLPSPAPGPLRGCPQCPQELLLLPHQLDNIK